MGLSRKFRDLSIKKKLTLIVLITSGAALLLACAGFLVYDWFTFREGMKEDLAVVAKGIEINIKAAMDFEDRQGALEHLDALTELYMNKPGAKFFGDSVPAENQTKFTPIKIVIAPTRIRVEAP